MSTATTGIDPLPNLALPDRLLDDRAEMPKLLEHTEVISHRKVLDDLRFLQAEAMDVFDCEFPAIGRECRPVQRRDHGKVSQVCARQSHLAHDRVAFSNERVDLKCQIRKGTAPSADDLLNGT